VNRDFFIGTTSAQGSHYHAGILFLNGAGFRVRVITDAEYQALYYCAPDIVKIAIELAYLSCARQADVLSMKKSQIVEEGILIKQSKTSVAQIKGWSPRLTSVINMASGLSLKPDMSSIFIIHQPNGFGYTRDGFNSRWSAAREEARIKFPGLLFDFTFHDLKAKGVSDLDGDLYEKRAITGHKNIEQTAAYDRKIVVVPVVGGQKKSI
jgi:integrase